jgi:hypothetical protein
MWARREDEKDVKANMQGDATKRKPFHTARNATPNK